MDKWEAHDIICKQLCKEIDQLAEQIQKTGNMNVQDLEKLDKMYHLKKDMLAVKGMEEADEYEEYGMSGDNQNGNSGYRGRAMNGRYVSRMNANNSYSDGYNRGYSEAMNRMNGGNSGHYMPYYDEPRRW